ncbi:MarR family transcriptional regulator [Paenibacillus lycopersici]|uniref:MarR family transcriptional regulator n=1 Tax=Paenibacillus lycopersici TaxID=2704462 RepID=A0A6C0G761_9BACL|nr:MarR family transcriptional regulator [Paenibacillus lycopersici]QHT63015.1 MarR family transcriptional regulator [Paenibacillus lycopersici]
MNPTPAERQNDLSLVDSLVQFSFLIQSILSKVGAPHDLSIIQIRLLGIVRDREPSMLQLAQYLGLDKSSITGLIDRAERRGLVQRVPSPTDRRGFHVRITEAGLRLTQTGAMEIERRINEAVAGLTEAERAQLSALAAKTLAGLSPSMA